MDEAPRLITGSAACESLTDCRQIRYRQAEDPCKQARTWRYLKCVGAPARAVRGPGATGHRQPAGIHPLNAEKGTRHGCIARHVSCLSVPLMDG
jgi:hypothetical protein